MTSLETTKRKRVDTKDFTREKKIKSDSTNQKEDNSNFSRLRVLLSVVGPLAVDINLAQIAVESDSEDSVECVELLSRDSRVDWNRRNESGDTPLMYCIKNNKTEMLEIIGGISGIRNTVTESGLSFMRDLIRQKREEIEKQKEILLSLEYQFEENKEVRYNQEYIEDEEEEYVEYPDPEIKQEQEKQTDSSQGEYVEYEEYEIKSEMKQ